MEAQTLMSPAQQTSFLASLTSGRAVSASQGGRRGSMLSGPLSDSVNRSKGEGNASPSGSFSSLNASAANLGSVEPPIERFMTCESDSPTPVRADIAQAKRVISDCPK